MKLGSNSLHVALIAGLALAGPSLAQGPQGPRTPAAAVLTADETKWLMYMREEEKLARDVYRVLYDRWNLRIFDNITDSEEQHFASIGNLLTRYKLADSALGAQGVFANEQLAALYAQLYSKGMRSVRDALEVGVMIERQDIDDLEQAIQTKKLDLKRVYNNLMAASFNHLDAFESTLALVESQP